MIKHIAVIKHITEETACKKIQMLRLSVFLYLSCQKEQNVAKIEEGSWGWIISLPLFVEKSQGFDPKSPGSTTLS